MLRFTNLNCNQICRTCLSEDGDLQSLFVEIDSIKLVDMLMACTPVQVSQNDDFPKQICHKCTDQLNRAYTFRQQCEKSNNVLDVYSKHLQSELKSENNSDQEVGETTRKTNLVLVPHETETDFLKTDNIKTEYLDYRIGICSEEFVTGKLSQLGSQQQVSDIEIEKKNENSSNGKKTCNICSKTLSASNISKHMRIHSNDTTMYYCEFCGKKFIWMTSYIRHKMIHKDSHSSENEIIDENQSKSLIENEYFTCTISSQKNTSDSSLHKQNLKNRKRYNCELCGKTYNKSYSFRQHIAKHNEAKPNQCDICLKMFITVSQLAYHVNECHPIDRSVDGVKETKKETVLDSTVQSKSSPYCDICKKNFATNSSLKYHRLQHGPKTFFCDECDKKFSTTHLLRLHKRVHTGEKPYRCDICDRRFTHSNAHRVHYRVHTGEKPYICKICNKSYKQRGQLNGHLLIHSGEKPFLCNICGERFGRNFKLKIHMRLHTGETPYLCPICGKGYRKASSLLKHRKSKVHANIVSVP